MLHETYHLPSLVGFFHQGIRSCFRGTLQEVGLSSDASDFLVGEEFPDTVTCEDEEFIVCLDLVLDYLYTKVKEKAQRLDTYQD